MKDRKLSSHLFIVGSFTREDACPRKIFLKEYDKSKENNNSAYHIIHVSELNLSKNI